MFRSHLGFVLFSAVLGGSVPGVLTAQIPEQLEQELPRLIQAAEIPSIQTT